MSKSMIRIIILFLSPLFNVLHIIFPYGWSRFQWEWIPILFSPLKIVLLILPILVSIGLYYKVRLALLGWMVYSRLAAKQANALGSANAGQCGYTTVRMGTIMVDPANDVEILGFHEN
ncbi:hypothetical protein P3G55_20395 [Leptospira sp. 96542]|nr:hypothetical protein [Leptospira sp. 96542]